MQKIVAGKSLRAINIEKCNVTKDQAYHVGKALFQFHFSSDRKNI